MPEDDMKLRDWFAGEALSAMLSNDDSPDFKTIEEHQVHYAKLAYGYADAMMAQRDKK